MTHGTRNCLTRSTPHISVDYILQQQFWVESSSKTLVYDLLRQRYPENVQSNLELYYDVNHRRHRDLLELIDNLRKNKASFLDREKDVERLISKVSEFREVANATTHSLPISVSSSEVQSYDIQYMIDLACYLMQ